MSEPGLVFDGVSKWYGQVSALTDIGFAVGPGVTGLVGQNGAGKSTLLKLACGLLRPSLGAVRVHGASPSTAAGRRRIGYCPDLDRFYERLSGRRFVTWMLRLSGLSRRAAARRSAELLEQLGLGGAMDRQIAGYSKGMRQRVKLAQALGHDPDVLLLDEPLTGLDPLARHDLSELLRQLGARGTSVVVSSHVLHELQAVADRFLLVHQGRLLAEGGVGELREQLADRPRRIALRSAQPRRLAAVLCGLDSVEGVQVGEDGVTILSRGGHDLWRSITSIGADPAGLVLEVRPLDDDLEAVFGYLVP